MEGLQREFSEYYGQIVRAIETCFNRLNTGSMPANLTAVLRFEIGRDGRVTAIRPYQRSGNGVFDGVAIESVECAGRGAIGPLPPAMPTDILPIEYSFRLR